MNILTSFCVAHFFFCMNFSFTMQLPMITLTYYRPSLSLPLLDHSCFVCRLYRISLKINRWHLTLIIFIHFWVLSGRCCYCLFGLHFGLWNGQHFDKATFFSYSAFFNHLTLVNVFYRSHGREIVAILTT